AVISSAGLPCHVWNIPTINSNETMISEVQITGELITNESDEMATK
ncbi:18035_t:CDS:1, partial [Acaulospora morrowiae]